MLFFQAMTLRRPANIVAENPLLWRAYRSFMPVLVFLQGLFRVVQRIRDIARLHHSDSFTLATFCSWFELVVPAVDAPGSVPDFVSKFDVRPGIHSS